MKFSVLLPLFICAFAVSSEQRGYSPSTNTTSILTEQVKNAPSVYPHSALNQVWKGAGFELISHPIFTLIAIVCLAVCAGMLIQGESYAACRDRKSDVDVRVLMLSSKSSSPADLPHPKSRKYDSFKPQDQLV